MQIGPNFKRLAIHKTSIEAIPSGGGIADGVKFLTTPGRLAQSMRDSLKWAQDAVLAIRQAAEPNSWKNSTDEEIAGELLRKIQERKKCKPAP